VHKGSKLHDFLSPKKCSCKSCFCGTVFTNTWFISCMSGSNLPTWRSAEISEK